MPERALKLVPVLELPLYSSTVEKNPMPERALKPKDFIHSSRTLIK
jgi:hypothetical protein